MTEKYVLEVNTDYETGEEHCTVLKTDGTTDMNNWITIISAMYTHHSVFEPLIKELNKLSDENEQLKEALIELKEIGDYQYTRIKELSDENKQLEQTNQRLTIALKEIKEKTNIYLEMTKKGEDQP